MVKPEDSLMIATEVFYGQRFIIAMNHEVSVSLKRVSCSAKVGFLQNTDQALNNYFPGDNSTILISIKR
jgi:hypothetical protein